MRGRFSRLATSTSETKKSWKLCVFESRVTRRKAPAYRERKRIDARERSKDRCCGVLIGRSTLVICRCPRTFNAHKFPPFPFDFAPGRTMPTKRRTLTRATTRRRRTCACSVSVHRTRIDPHEAHEHTLIYQSRLPEATTCRKFPFFFFFDREISLSLTKSIVTDRRSTGEEWNGLWRSAILRRKMFVGREHLFRRRHAGRGAPLVPIRGGSVNPARPVHASPTGVAALSILRRCIRRS